MIEHFCGDCRKEFSHKEKRRRKWPYLDDHDVVWVLARLVQNGVAGDHVIDDIALRDLLGPECLRGREIHSVVVAEMVVAHDRCRLFNHHILIVKICLRNM